LTAELLKFCVFRRNGFSSTFNEHTVMTKLLDLFKLGIFKVGFKMYLFCVPLKPYPVFFVGLICEKTKIDYEIM